MENATVASQIANEAKRYLRWQCIYLIYQSRSVHQGKRTGISDHTLMTSLNRRFTPTEPANLRDILIDLQDRSFCECQAIADETLYCTITTQGIDLVEYNAECPQAISRPSNT